MLRLSFFLGSLFFLSSSLLFKEEPGGSAPPPVLAPRDRQRGGGDARTCVMQFNAAKIQRKNDNSKSRNGIIDEVSPFLWIVTLRDL